MASGRISWDIEWEVGAVEALKRLPSWRIVAQVCRAMKEFADHGTGDVRLVHTQEYRLHVGSCVVRFGIDTPSRTLHVWTVFQKN